ncbi:hypothetical protein P154DRAFT_134612 [Amniculicola lignicola CBS 123094]|uniref:Rhodanese domain-containing protein n=1 Tax=Amniculicola lignicola CBS 123094 TaxID=1392246 RepID=A0A6A5WLD5_9PLEO|nr:hypothetical protein P154DRAFT_134612 [Amniculicola lignicola CBS 123094]
MSSQYLIDVRTPEEFSAARLGNAINIEYQIINHLPDIFAAKGVEVKLSDAITMYCKSGRRSGIAVQTLKGLGYENVRSIGGFEEAKEILLREKVLGGMNGEVNGKRGSVKVEVKRTEEEEKKREETRKKGLGALMAGLKGLE